jgi:hypothetical protein
VTRFVGGEKKRPQDLERLALVHRAVAVRHLVERTDAVEDAVGLDPSLKHVGQQLLDVGAYRCGPPPMVAFFQNATPVGVTSCSGIPTRPTAPPGRAISSAVSTALFEPDALEHRMRTKSARQLTDALDGLVTALADGVGSEIAVKNS